MNNLEKTANTKVGITKWIVIGIISIAFITAICVAINKTVTGVEKVADETGKSARALFEIPVDIINSIFAGISSAYSELEEGVVAIFETKDNSKTVYVVQGNIEEEWLAVTASREIDVKYQYSSTWGKSTKTIDLVATYRVQAGVDLAKVEYDVQRNLILINNAKGIIISCERIKLRELTESNGWWNKIGDEDRISAQNALDEEARQQAQSEDILKEALDNFVKKVQVGAGVPEEEFKFIIAPPL